MKRKRDLTFFFALALTFSAAAWAQYLGPVGSFKTPLQNQMRSTAATGVPVGTRLPTNVGSSAFGCCGGMTARDRDNMMSSNSYLPGPGSLTGRGMASYAVGRGLTRGMRF